MNHSDFQKQKETANFSGAETIKFDEGKLRLSLIPRSLFIALGTVLTYGARKYEPYNWAKGTDWSRLYDATLRHLTAWWDGEDKDPESGYSHLWHALTNICFLIVYVAHGRGKDDRPKEFGPL